VGWDWVHLVPRPLINFLYHPRMIDEWGAVGGMRIDRGNRSTLRKLAPRAILLNINPTWYDLELNQNRRGGKAAAEARPFYNLKSTMNKMTELLFLNCIMPAANLYPFHSIQRVRPCICRKDLWIFVIWILHLSATFNLYDAIECIPLSCCFLFFFFWNCK
jgi:hypothetical protein